jgi:hypothetical protein
MTLILCQKRGPDLSLVRHLLEETIHRHSFYSNKLELKHRSWMRSDF